MQMLQTVLLPSDITSGRILPCVHVKWTNCCRDLPRRCDPIDMWHGIAEGITELQSEVRLHLGVKSST